MYCVPLGLRTVTVFPLSLCPLAYVQLQSMPVLSTLLGNAL